MHGKIRTCFKVCVEVKFSRHLSAKSLMPKQWHSCNQFDKGDSELLLIAWIFGAACYLWPASLRDTWSFYEMAQNIWLSLIKMRPLRDQVRPCQWQPCSQGVALPNKRHEFNALTLNYKKQAKTNGLRKGQRWGRVGGSVCQPCETWHLIFLLLTTFLTTMKKWWFLRDSHHILWFDIKMQSISCSSQQMKVWFVG